MRLRIAVEADYSVRLRQSSFPLLYFFTPMELLDYLRRQLTYDEWANREVLTGLRASTQLPTRPLQLLAHILSAERLWLERLKQQPQSLPVWPDFTFDQCEVQITELAKLWREYLAQLSSAELSKKVDYKNSKGEQFTSSVEDVLTHVVLHSAYHRGQIASLMRAAGEQPAYTDFIHAARQGLIE
jgi:uncharacterized damage-inducible protein DinB